MYYLGAGNNYHMIIQIIADNGRQERDRWWRLVDGKLPQMLYIGSKSWITDILVQNHVATKHRIGQVSSFGQSWTELNILQQEVSDHKYSWMLSNCDSV